MTDDAKPESWEQQMLANGVSEEQVNDFKLANGIKRPTPGVADHLTSDGAHALARRLRDYWWSKGRVVNTGIEPVSIGRETVFGVRSDLIGGLPQTIPMQVVAE
jgi:hypothetical protein